MQRETSATFSPRRRGYFFNSDAVLKRLAAALLPTNPDGALTIEFPAGARWTLGEATRETTPLVRLTNGKVFLKIIQRGALGAAQAYIDGDFECADLTGLLRFFIKNENQMSRAAYSMLNTGFRDKIAHGTRANTRTRAQENIAKHYDLSNAFFRSWLDPQMVYSSGYYQQGCETLEEAQLAKMDLILELLGLTDQETVLEIGSGWGALARHLAMYGGAQVYAITLSHEQLAQACELAANQNLSHQCQFDFLDYRELSGTFDRIVSIEMIEAVGEAYWPTYFNSIDQHLMDDGIAIVQAITIEESRFDAYRKNADFIQSYIFPGGVLPTKTHIHDHAAAVGLTIDKAVQFGKSYARTLKHWRERFEAAWAEIEQLGFDEAFRRRWRYYLAYCEAGFLEDIIDVGVYRLRKAKK